MKRWTYLIPRIIILLLASLAIWMSTDPLMKRLLTYQIERSTGGQVTMGQVRCSLVDQKILVHDLTVSDPRNPMKNWLQADMAYLDLDLARLLDGQIEIESIDTSRLVFGSPRTTAAAASEDDPREPRLPLEQMRQAQTAVRGVHQEWLDQLLPRTASPGRLVSAPTSFNSTQQETSWGQELEAIRDSWQQLSQQTEKMHQSVVDSHGNPLRRWKPNQFISLESAEEANERLQVRLASLKLQVQRGLAEMGSQWATHRQHQAQRESLQPFQAANLDKVLLSGLHARYVDDAINFARWFRQVTPDSSDFLEQSQRGKSFQLPGVDRLPRLLIRKVDLNGEGQFGGEHFEFAGTASNLTPQPERYEHPVQFEIRAQGRQHMIVQATTDRRGPLPKDKIRIVCPDLVLGAKQLGAPESLQVTLGEGCRLLAEIELTLTGDRIEGTLVLDHQGTSLFVDQLSELAGGQEIALQMNQGIGQIDHFHSTLQISGTLDDYQFSGTSDLGKQFAAGVNQSLQERSRRVAKMQHAKLESQHREQVLRIKQQFEGQIANLEQQLGHGQARIAELQKLNQASSKLR